MSIFLLSILGYFLFGFLFTFIVNKITYLDGIDGVVFWPIMILILIIYCGELILKFVFDKLNIPHDINPSIYEN